MIKLFHVITGLQTGGAEIMLFKLLSNIDRSKFECEVVSLIKDGPIGDRIREIDVPVRSLHMNRGTPNPLPLLKLIGWLKCYRPHVVQSWMYHADLFAGIAAKLAGGIPIVWGIRHGVLDSESMKHNTIRIVKVCAKLSGILPSRIVCCSEVSRKTHADLGYPEDKMEVIYNGFDLTTYKPDSSAREEIRKGSGIPHKAPLIGLIARFNPQKDHETFFEAAAKLHSERPKTHFLLCGEGITWENTEISMLIKNKSYRQNVHLMGLREDIPRITAALDIATSSSSDGEGFPNSIGEAMACGVPCVVTDVGESPLIVGDCGIIVPPKDSTSLANGWLRLVDLESSERKKLGELARQRVEENFSIAKAVKKFEALYAEHAESTI